jgi:hypothetical protein
VRGFVMWCDGESDNVVEVEELESEMLMALDGEAEAEENWYKADLVYPDGRRVLEFDDEFETLQMQPREPGVVDWEAMEEHFTTPPPPGWDVRDHQ